MDIALNAHMGANPKTCFIPVAQYYYKLLTLSMDLYFRKIEQEAN